jgi:DNA modification methylase
MNNQIVWTEVKVLVKDLIPADYNPRKLEVKEKADLTESINKFGRAEPIVLNIGSRKNCIIGGHQRIKIYADLGVTEVEAKIPSRELTETEEKELNLRLNKNLGSWDLEKLMEMDLTLLQEVGFDDNELSDIYDDVDVLEDPYDVKKALKDITIPIVKTGEIWQLGEHKLLVGSSTDEAAVKLLMDKDLATIVYCDPPYNIGLDYSKGIGSSEKYEGNYSSKDDSKTDDEYQKFMEDSITVAKKFALPDSHFFYWCDSTNIGLIQSIYTDNKIKNKRVCIWIKNNQNPTPKIAFNKVHEPCVYGVSGKPFLNDRIRNANEVLNKEVSSGNQLHDEVLEMLDLWVVKRDKTTEYLHPTQKPVSLNEKPLKRCSAPGQIVFSGFAGSGSDLIACEILKRKWRGVEQDLIFATIVIDRWEKFTNQKAIRIYESK